MKVEYSEYERVSSKKNKKRKAKRNRAIVAITAIFLVLCVVVGIIVAVFFNVKDIKVIGQGIYTQEEIIYASGILNGDNLLFMSSSTIENRVREALPYLKNVEIIKSFPNKVGIKVTSAVEEYLLENKNGKYVADKDFKILRVTAEIPQNLIRVKGLTTDELKPGVNATFSDKQQRDAFFELLKILNEKKINVKYINIESLVNISFMINDNLYIKLGSFNDVVGKIEHLEASLDQVDDEMSASISLIDWSINNKKAILKYEDVSKYLE